jgi:hypothetical protein
MEHRQLQLAKDRQQELLAAATAAREGQRAQLHERLARRAERAERRRASQGDQAARLRARLTELESAC